MGLWPAGEIHYNDAANKALLSERVQTIKVLRDLMLRELKSLHEGLEGPLCDSARKQSEKCQRTLETIVWLDLEKL